MALLSAREHASKGVTGLQGMSGGPALTVYASREAHSSVDKGVKLAGYGLERLRRIATDAAFAMDPAALERAIERDLAAGLRPACVVAPHRHHLLHRGGSRAGRSRRSAGGTGSGSTWTRPTPGSAAIVPELRRPIRRAWEPADSIVLNPHKWLLTNFDCTAYYVRDRDALLSAFSLTPEYLRTAHDDEVVNYRDWGIQLGRRFRALKLWFVIRSYGVEGLRAIIRRHVALARRAGRAGWTRRPTSSGWRRCRSGWCAFATGRRDVAEEELDRLNERLLTRGERDAGGCI